MKNSKGGGSTDSLGSLAIAAVPLKWKVHSQWWAKIKTTAGLTPKLQAPTCIILPCTVLWKLFKWALPVEELPAVFSAVVHLKRSTWSEEIWNMIFPAEGPWSSWAASTEPHCHLIGSLLHFCVHSDNFVWRDYLKGTIHCWGFLSFGTGTVSFTICTGWQSTYISLIIVSLWERM